jgi:2-polyprenyl-3-methyl-5-hydroxy-6-metoxy-1,4-benzoquinol methylase
MENRMATVELTMCPGCGDTEPRFIDRILDGYHFGGRDLEIPISGGGLYECNSCKLAFRSPRLTKQQIDVLYADTLIDHWGSSEEDRPDWVIAKKIINEIPSAKSILDVGCFDGQFLEFLGGDYTRYGIEIHLEASRLASAKGIQMVGKDAIALSHLTSKYDIAVAMDVIEHFDNPQAFLTSLARVVKPGGTILISTGNFESAPWRIMRGMYWYCSLAEHLAFISPTWAKKVSQELGLTVRNIDHFSHSKSSLPKVVIHIGANLAYRYAYRSTQSMREVISLVLKKPTKAVYRLPPKWLGASDHFMVAFRKNI